MRIWPVALALSLLPAAVQAQSRGAARAPVTVNGVIKDVRLEQKLNAQVPLDLPFRDETGRAVRLHEYFGRKPVMLVLIQYRCTMLCSTEMEILTQSLKELKFTPGKEFNLVIVSIDPREDPELAAGFKKSYLEEYGRPEAANGWHLLTGAERDIRRLAKAVGFHYAYDAGTDQYAHPDGVILLTPLGKVTRYFFQLNYPPRDLRLGLVEAAQNKIGTILDRVALLCYHYNPVSGTYGLAVMGLLRLGALALVLLMGGGILVMTLRERHGRQRPGRGVESEAR